MYKNGKEHHRIRRAQVKNNNNDKFLLSFPYKQTTTTTEKKKYKSEGLSIKREKRRENIWCVETIICDTPRPPHATNLIMNSSNSNINSSNPELEEEEVFQRIQTHFPPAKIKKIMQTDEDIGKVSQATPVIAGRALELFVSMLVSQAGQTARSTGNKRISADTLRETIMHSEKFDFLREAVCGDDADADAVDAVADASASADGSE